MPKYPHHSHTMRNALLEEWNNIPMRRVNAFSNSMQRRIRATTATRGDTDSFDFHLQLSGYLQCALVMHLHLLSTSMRVYQ